MIEARAVVEDPALTVEDYLTEWLCPSRARVRTTTYQGYEGLIRLYALPRIGHLPLSALRPLHLQRIYSELVVPSGSLSGGTVLNLHLVLTQALGQPVRWGLLVTNPATGAQPPRPGRPEPRVVDAALASRTLSLLPGTSVEVPAAVA